MKRLFAVIALAILLVVSFAAVSSTGSKKFFRNSLYSMNLVVLSLQLVRLILGLQLLEIYRLRERILRKITKWLETEASLIFELEPDIPKTLLKFRKKKQKSSAGVGQKHFETKSATQTKCLSG